MRKRSASSVAIAVGTICCVCLALTTTAETPIARVVKFRKVESDANKVYQLTEAHGPWMIFAASFAGQGAEREANSLVQEVRKRYKLPAFIHKQGYDYTGTVTGIGLDRYGEPRKMRYQQPIAFDEFAVLVGNFPTHNDPNAAKVLKALKHAQPHSLQLDKGSKSTLRFAGLRHLQKQLTGNETKQQKGPLGQAFVTRNPMLPKEYFAPTGVDAMVASMNQGVEHSLLDCPGKYTVQVATFRGAWLIDQKKIQEVKQRAGAMSGRLAEAAEQAHQLTTILRKRNVEAYEFHDRNESIVTVGSFDSVGTPRQDGRTEINPAVLRIMNTYGAQQKPLPGGAQTGLVPRQLGGITFDVQGKPVEVPRRSIATDYAHSNSKILNWK